MHSRTLTGLLVTCLLVGCRGPAPQTASEKSEAPLPKQASTTLEHGGCSLELPGAWTIDEAATKDVDGAVHFEAERSDGEEALIVFGAPWKVPKLEQEWREDLGAIIGLRRSVEEEQGVSLSEPEYVGDGKNPGAFFTSISADGSEAWLTLVKATPSWSCSFFVNVPVAERAKLVSRARETLETAKVSR